ncbi:hypothetical protein ACFCP7_24575 [Paenibacillus elgii]
MEVKWKRRVGLRKQSFKSNASTELDTKIPEMGQREIKATINALRVLRFQ